jgi:hypothetical protein
MGAAMVLVMPPYPDRPPVITGTGSKHIQFAGTQKEEVPGKKRLFLT